MRNRKPKKSYWIYGKHAVIAALENSTRQVIRVFVTKAASRNIHPLSSEKYKTQIVDIGKIEKHLPKNAVHQGIACEVQPLVGPSLEEVYDKQLIIALDQVTDPQNVGAILRSAAAFGVAAIIIPFDNAVTENGTLAKAASGALEIVPIVGVTNLSVTIDKLKQAGFWVLGLDSAAETDLQDAPIYEKVVLVMGSEGKGLRRLTSRHCDLLLRLPISDRIESLNVSTAASIAIYELTK